jgi:hypothetical protein
MDALELKTSIGVYVNPNNYNLKEGLNKQHLTDLKELLEKA